MTRIDLPIQHRERRVREVHDNKEMSPQDDARRDEVKTFETIDYVMIFLAACMPILMIIMAILLIASLKYYGYL